MFDPLSAIRRTDPERLAQMLVEPPNGRLMYWGWWNETRNAGDWIGPWLYLALTGNLPIHVGPSLVPPPYRAHVTCGSILQKLSRPDAAVVWGAGIMNAGDPIVRPAAVHAVRGPLTQEALDRQGWTVPDVVGDPGLCLPLIFDVGSRATTHRLGIVSHIVDMVFWTRLEKTLPRSVRVIHMNRPLEAVIADIASCEAVVSSSLHGVIIAHAYGIPASVMKPVTHALVGDGSKFRDYYRSVEMDFTLRDCAEMMFPVKPGVLIRRAVLPDADLDAMARRLLAVCPFAPET